MELIVLGLNMLLNYICVSYLLLSYLIIYCMC